MSICVASILTEVLAATATTPKRINSCQLTNGSHSIVDYSSAYSGPWVILRFLLFLSLTPDT
jgi:hypothetical protein